MVNVFLAVYNLSSNNQGDIAMKKLSLYCPLLPAIPAALSFNKQFHARASTTALGPIMLHAS